MKRALFISIAALVVIVCVVVVVFQKQEKGSYEIAEIEVVPKINFRQQAPKDVLSISKDKEQLLKEFLPPTPQPERVEGASDTVEVQDTESPRDRLHGKIASWRYRSFFGIGTEKEGTIEDLEVRNIWPVTEGRKYRGVRIDELTERYCAVSIQGASTRLTLIPPESTPTPTRKEVVKGGPPSKAEAKRRYETYRAKVMPTFEYLDSLYTPRPGETVRREPPSEEEVQTAVARYFATMEPTIRASKQGPEWPGEHFPEQPSSEEEAQATRAAWIATNRPEAQDGSGQGFSSEFSEEGPTPAPNRPIRIGP